jgi:outer membrane receptor for ferric coprogen and ferric-rhodotorulic acid
MRLGSVFCAVVCCVFVHPPLAFSQSAAGFVLEGRVLDQSQAPIPNARVTAVPEGQPAGSSTVTDQRGAFTFSLAPGNYTLLAVADGFLEQSVAVNGTGGRASREFVLKVAGVSEAVTVSADAVGYRVPIITSATKTPTPLLDVPQSVTVVTQELNQNQLMTSMGDVMRYVPGVSVHQGENNRDQVIIRGNSSSADFFVDGVRDDVHYRDLHNLSRVEVLRAQMRHLSAGRPEAS